jgi:hypothetical protein
VTVRDFEQRQQQVHPNEDLAPYAGQWVALREGHVVASDRSGVALRDHPDVRSGDVLMPVPPASSIFIL